MIIYEYTCLILLQYNLNHFTAYLFINFFICHGYLFSDEFYDINTSDKEGKFNCIK